MIKEKNYERFIMEIINIIQKIEQTNGKYSSLICRNELTLIQLIKMYFYTDVSFVEVH